MAFSPITVSQMISDCQYMLDDDTVPTATQLLRSLNDARNKVFADTQALADEYSISSLAYTTKYTLADNVYDVRDIRFYHENQSNEVEPFTIKQYNDLGSSEQSSEILINRYYKKDRVLNFWPIPSAYVYSDTLNGALSAGALSLVLTVGTEVLPSTGTVTIGSETIYYGAKTDLTKTLSSLTRGYAGTTDADHDDDSAVQCPLSTLAYRDTLKTSISDVETGRMYLTTGTTKLPYSGRLLVGSEVIGWGAKDDLSGSLIALSRAMEGTTAASHTALDPITHRDILIGYYKSPEDLTTASYLEVALNAFYKCFEYYMCWQAKMRDTDDINATGVNSQMQNFYSLYQAEEYRLNNYLKGRHDGIYKVNVVE